MPSARKLNVTSKKLIFDIFKPDFKKSNFAYSFVIDGKPIVGSAGKRA